MMTKSQKRQRIIVANELYGYLGEMFYNVFIYQQIFDGIQMKIDYIGEI